MGTFNSWSLQTVLACNRDTYLLTSMTDYSVQYALYLNTQRDEQQDTNHFWRKSGLSDNDHASRTYGLSFETAMVLTLLTEIKQRTIF